MCSFFRFASVFSVLVATIVGQTSLIYANDAPQFESDILPVFLSKCGKCHGDKAREANLDLRTMAAIRRGGDSGPALPTVNAKGESLLLQRIDDGDMPPEDEPQLSSAEIALVRRWLTAGAPAKSENERDEWSKRLEQAQDYWAFRPLERPVVPGVELVRPLQSRRAINPDDQSVQPALQAWFRADQLVLQPGERVSEWQDASGNERHLRPTWGRLDAQTGTPPRFVPQSTVGMQPAVRFDDTAGLGSPADRPVSIQGDGSWTILVAVNIRPPAQSSHTSVIVGFGDPAPGHNPGRPWASLLEIRRDSAFLSHSGGYGHDARMPNQSMWSYYEQPVVLTMVKEPGPMAAATSLFVNGRRIAQEQITGVGTAPAIRHREDFGLYLGRANGSLGGLRGDVAEVAIYNIALNDDLRESLEAGFVRKYKIQEPSALLHPIDTFIDSKLDAIGLAAAPAADRRTLIRRAYFDLIGLPPKPEEVAAFLNDQTAGAWERVIERLLNSPHYGERWGRHWLDVARYADTGGYETDIYYRNAWRFRDYVVKSFNEDKPYDQFVQEQIAGDEIWPDNLDLHGSYIMDPEQKRHFEALTGTGFYALGPQIHESNMDAKKLSNERLTDWVDTTGAAFLGLTFGCARCHDHKFDPISQRDYYALQAIFASSREVEVPLQHGMGLADWRQHYPKVIALEEARRAYRDYEKRTGGRQRTPAENARLSSLKNAIADRLLALPETDAQRQRYAGIYERPTVTALGPRRRELTRPVRLLSRGELDRPKQVMSADLPKFLAQSIVIPTKEGSDSGNEQAELSRKDLALWLTRPEHPLTARVMANRIWQWHFGRGIVATPSDFGKMGVPPTHPELLDWLAAEFVAQGWSIKSLHRLIMTSAAYRRSSEYYVEKNNTTDPDNTLLWRMNRRRLEGEAIWDTIHSVAGTINLSVGGRPVMPPLLAEELTNKSNWVESQLKTDHTRRGLYIIVRRNFNFPLFDLFDAPVNAVSCSGRDASTVAPQALWLLNNRMAFNQAQQFAARLVREAGQDPASQVRRAWLLALGRQATEQEVREAVELLAELETREPSTTATAGTDTRPKELASLRPEQAAALTKLCLTIFNLNEFIFVD